MFAYYDNHRRTHVVGYVVTCIVDSEAHACRPAVPSLYQTMTKKIIRPLQSVSIYKFFVNVCILQSDVITS